MDTILLIESKMAGMIIGRAGSRIKSIQQDSGASIKVIDGDTLNTRKVKITGPEAAQLLARNIIEKITGKILSSQTIASSPPSQKRQQRPSRPRPSQRASSPLEQINISEECWEEIRRENLERERLLKESLGPIKKDFYVEHDEIKAMSIEDVDAFRLTKNNIMVQYVDGADTTQTIPKPIKTFQHAFHAYPEIMKVIKKQKFIEPSPIQCQAWPIIMSGHDLIAIAQTGTGKTLAYILPALIHLLRQPTPRNERIGPSVLILGPTRELVLQIESEIKKYIFDNINVISIYGGVSIEKQTERLLDEKSDIVVATPGRLNEMASVKSINLTQVTYLVLDEADRMLDMGFKVQIEFALRYVRPDRQTIFTSATWPIGVRELVNYFSINPIHITIGSLDLTTVNTVEQKVIVLKEYQKDTWLEDFLSKNISKKDKIIIFLRKKASVDKLYEKLKVLNIDCGLVLNYINIKIVLI